MSECDCGGQDVDHFLARTNIKGLYNIDVARTPTDLVESKALLNCID